MYLFDFSLIHKAYKVDFNKIGNEYKMIVDIGKKQVGPSKPCYLIAEIGINHNGQIDLAKKLILKAKEAGFDVVKFQKRVPELCVPKEKREELRITPWGNISYFSYKEKIEFSKEQYDEINKFCNNIGIEWAASAWDIESVKFLSEYKCPFIKIPSDKTKDLEFVKVVADTGMPIIISCGGTSISELEDAFKILDTKKTILLQCTSEYPTPSEKLNLRAMRFLEEKFKLNIGLSSHHTSPVMAAMAAAYGAKVIEVHVTLDRAMWGTDQAMSLEPRGMEVLCTNVRAFEIALGSPEKVLYEKELSTLSRTIKK